MKLHLFFVISLLFPNNTVAKIINAYEKDLASANASLAHLRNMPMQAKVKKQILILKQLIANYESTAILLSQFKTTAPALYNQIDTIRDFKGRTVDVYVKVVPQKDLPSGLSAMTGIRQLPGDPHAYDSNYGPYTVSVKIARTQNPLLILAHEFGHIAYQVPNLASYARFFSLNYTGAASEAGHKLNDPSGHKAAHFEKSFHSIFMKLKRTKFRNR